MNEYTIVFTYTDAYTRKSEIRTEDVRAKSQEDAAYTFYKDWPRNARILVVLTNRVSYDKV